MAQAITHFEIDKTLTDDLKPFQVDNGGGDPNTDWPGNVISRLAVVYGSGRIARRGEVVRHAVDPAELALCRRLADQAAGLMTGIDSFGTGPTPLLPFYVAANVGDPVSESIDVPLIQWIFGSTLFPMAEIVVEPLKEEGPWWDKLVDYYDYNDEDEEEMAEMLAELDRWRVMVRWFRECPDFVTSAYVRVGDNLEHLPNRDLPKGCVAFGCVVPHLTLGLTRGGSVAGFIGSVVRA